MEFCADFLKRRTFVSGLLRHKCLIFLLHFASALTVISSVLNARPSFSFLSKCIFFKFGLIKGCLHFALSTSMVQLHSLYSAACWKQVLVHGIPSLAQTLACTESHSCTMSVKIQSPSEVMHVLHTPDTGDGLLIPLSYQDSNWKLDTILRSNVSSE